MKQVRILLFITSCFVFVFGLYSQEINETTNDTLPKSKDKYGLRVGGDLSKILRTALDDKYSGFEILGDFRFSEKFYAAAEIGNETRDWDEENLRSTTKGSYIKLGADYNAYNNWLNMNNSIYAGLRYGFATFSQELNSYGIYTTDSTFPVEEVISGQEFSGLTASWIELQVGVKTELVSNLFLSINVQLKRKVSEEKPDNFDNLIIPGFNRTYDFSQFGVGYGYTLSYLIPIFKK
ncbi:MAG: hypothetical protein HKN48_13390 [Flavobacteriaceae bacterium]|nr:hypothetical protein [Flavobacteriaceae bacterium]